MNVYGNTMAMTSKSLEYLWAKQETIVNNIANVETPGYKTKFVTFEDEFSSRLKSAIGAKENNQVQGVLNNTQYKINDTRSESSKLDGNNVDADVENVELARTTLQYQYQVQSVNSDITRMRTVVKGQ